MAEFNGRPSLQEKKQPLSDDVGGDAIVNLEGEVVNASGHRDQLQRQYGLLSICGMALTVDNAWVAIGTSMSIAICKLVLPWMLPEHKAYKNEDNGGPPGVLYEFLVACFYYAFINASIAEVNKALSPMVSDASS